VAAPGFLGRATLISALNRYEAEGAWGISPHLIPHRSLHAVSGTISQILKIQGPNIGAGGAPGAGVDGLLAGAVLLEGHRLPGVWVVLSDWEPEMIPDETGRLAPVDAICWAVALALVPSRPGWFGPRLCITARGPERSDAPLAGQVARSFSGLEALLRALSNPGTTPITAVWRLDGGGWIEFKAGGTSVSPPNYRTVERFLGRSVEGHAGAVTEKRR
jgi:hypothetical protein